jgi:hypothetical protein
LIDRSPMTTSPKRPAKKRHRIRHSQCTQSAAPTRTTKEKRPRHSHSRAARPFQYPHGESNFCVFLGRYRSRGKFRTKFRTTLGGPRRRRSGSTPHGSPGGATPSPREPDAARRRRRVALPAVTPARLLHPWRNRRRHGSPRSPWSPRPPASRRPGSRARFLPPDSRCDKLPK